MSCLIRGSCGTVTTIRGSDPVIVIVIVAVGAGGGASHFDMTDKRGLTGNSFVSADTVGVTVDGGCVIACGVSAGDVVFTGTTTAAGAVAGVGHGIGGKGGCLGAGVGTVKGLALIFTAFPQFKTIAQPSSSYSCNSNYNNSNK
jgi:hypothetical protein